MTAPTPGQMRALAERLAQMAESRRMDFDESNVAMTLDESAVALHAAADQLEAVRNLLQECSDWKPGRPRLEWSINDHYFVDTEFWSRLTAILDPKTEQDVDDD